MSLVCLSSYYNNRGLALYRLDRFDMALADFDEAINTDSTDPNFFFNRGNVRRAKGVRGSRFPLFFTLDFLPSW